MRGGQDQALREGVEPAPPRAAAPTGAPGRPANARGGARAPGLAESGGARPSCSEPRSPGDSGPPVRTEVPGIQQQERDAAAASPDGRARAGPPPTSVGNAEPPAARMPQPLRGGHAPSSPRGPRGKNYMQRAALTKHSGPHLDSEKRLRRCEA